MTALSDNDLAWFAARLSLAVYDTNRETPAMLIHEMREALKGLPGLEDLQITYQPDGNQLLQLGDKVLEIGPMASNEEIKAALLNPFIPTANTKVHMATSPLQGIGLKLGLLKHSAEALATKISARVDALSPRLDAAGTKSLAALDNQEKDVVDLETFVSDVEKATNA